MVPISVLASHFMGWYAQNTQELTCFSAHWLTCDACFFCLLSSSRVKSSQCVVIYTASIMTCSTSLSSTGYLQRQTPMYPLTLMHWAVAQQSPLPGICGMTLDHFMPQSVWRTIDHFMPQSVWRTIDHFMPQSVWRTIDHFMPQSVWRTIDHFMPQSVWRTIDHFLAWSVWENWYQFTARSSQFVYGTVQSVCKITDHFMALSVWENRY